MTNQNPTVVFRDLIEATRNDLNVHNHLKGKSVEELQEISRADRLPYHVMCISLTGDLNIGSIIRSSHIFGAQKVWIFGRRKFDSRGTVGSQNYIDIERVYGFEGDPRSHHTDDIAFDFQKFSDLIEANNLFPIFIEQGGINLNEMNWAVASDLFKDKIPCLIFGNETNGIPDEFMTVDSIRLSIPQKGIIRSLNVSNAASIVLYDFVRSMGWF